MKILFILLVCISVAFSQSQIQPIEITDDNLVALLNNIELLSEKKVDTLFIRIFETNNEPGSADFPNGEVTSNILFAVSGFDDYPEQNLFVISSLYSPKILEIVNENSIPTIYMSYIVETELKIIEIEVYLKNIIISEIKNNNIFLAKDSSVIFYQPSEIEINELISDEESGFNEVISDFSYHTKSVEKYLIENGIKPIFTSVKFIIVDSYSKDPKILLRNKFEHPVGFILSNGNNSIIIKEGVYTNSEIKHITSDYFNIPKSLNNN